MVIHSCRDYTQSISNFASGSYRAYYVHFTNLQNYVFYILGKTVGGCMVKMDKHVGLYSQVPDTKEIYTIIR